MTPMICDFTGKVIEAKYDPKHGPQLGRDYYQFYNRIVSEEAKEEIERIIWNTMKNRGFGNYNFGEYKKVMKAAIEQLCNKGQEAVKRHFQPGTKYA